MKQISFKSENGWGGKRAGAGRKNNTGCVNHMRRPQVELKFPLLITVRIKKGLPNIRRESLLRELKSSLREAQVFGLYVNHFAMHPGEFQLIAEATDKKALGRGMRSIGGRFGRAVRRFAAERGGERNGSVFHGRYRLQVLRSATETKAALEAILTDDPFTSTTEFEQWHQPRSALLSAGWMKSARLN
jgi:hypothetical protein